MTADFLSEKTQEGRQQSNVLKILKPPYPTPTPHDPPKKKNPINLEFHTQRKYLAKTKVK